MAKQNSRVRGKQPEKAAAQRTPFPLSWWLAVSCIFAFCVAAYRPALHGPFLFDDTHLPFSDPNAATAPPAFWIGGVRPVLMVTYWANFLAGGLDTFSYHALSLLFHIATGVLVFFVIARVLDLAGDRDNVKLKALFGAGLYLLHPLQTESVAYIAGRSEIIAGLFYFAAWLVFLRYFRRDIGIFAAAGILLLCALAVLGKESAISLPAIFILTDLYWNPAGFGEQVRARIRLFAPMIVVGLAGAVMIVRGLTSATSAGFSGSGATPTLYALTQCRSILTYLRLFLIPTGQNGDWGFAVYRSLTDRGAWLWVLGLAGLVAATVWSYRRARLLSFGLAVFLVTLAPTSSFVPIRDAIAERRVYVPIIGLIFASIWACIWALDRIRLRIPVWRTVAAVVLILAAVLSYERNKVWSSDLLFWYDSAIKNPANGRAHLGLGNAYLKVGRCVNAAREFQAVVRAEGPSDQTATNLAAAYQCNHQPELALKELRSVVSRRPSANLWTQIGYLEGTMGHGEESMSAFERSLQLDSRYALAYAYRGIIRVVSGDRPGAEDDLRKALEIDPENKVAAYGVTMLNGKG